MAGTAWWRITPWEAICMPTFFLSPRRISLMRAGDIKGHDGRWGQRIIALLQLSRDLLAIESCPA